MSILSNLKTLKPVANAVAKDQMTDQQVTEMRQKLRDQNRMNVQPNKFDRAKPFRVAAKLKGTNEWKTHGYFTNVDVASAIGTLVSAAQFGDKAMRGDYDAEVVETHPEYLAWLEDARNAPIVAALS